MTDYKQLREAIDKKLSTDPEFRTIVKRINGGRATFIDTERYAQITARAVSRELSAEVLDLSDREGITTQILRDSYEDINATCARVQRAMDEKAGIHIRPQQENFPAERVQQFTHSLVDPTVEDSVIKRRARAGSDTIVKSAHDDFIRKNATFRNDAGLTCYIIRQGSNCCDWCTKVAGKYRFGEQPSDIFRRHDNCDCTIIYDGQVLRGKQNADGSRSKTWEEPPNTNSDYTPAVLSEADARAVEQRNLQRFRGVNVNNSSIDNSVRNGIISSRGSGKNSALSDNHSYEKIGEIDFKDKKAVARSLAEFESKYQSSDIEHCRVICPDGNVYEVHGDRCRVNTGLLGDKMNGSINDHNHVTGESQYSFSWEDISSSAEDGSHIVMAYDEKYRYSMTFPDKAIDANVLREAYDVSENEVDLNNFNYQYYSIGSRISDEDHQHEIIKRTCERVGVKYERKLKT